METAIIAIIAFAIFELTFVSGFTLAWVMRGVVEQ